MIIIVPKVPKVPRVPRVPEGPRDLINITMIIVCKFRQSKLLLTPNYSFALGTPGLLILKLRNYFNIIWKVRI